VLIATRSFKLELHVFAITTVLNLNIVLLFAMAKLEPCPKLSAKLKRKLEIKTIIYEEKPQGTSLC
jgi:hypothetical protein